MAPGARTPSGEPAADAFPDPRPEPDMDEAMAVFRDRAATANRHRARAIADAFDAMSKGTLASAERAEARAAAHTIAGSAGTFGFAEASRLAREIEQVWDALNLPADHPEGGGVDVAELLRRGLDLLARLRDSLGEEPAQQPDPSPDPQERERP
ncbi:Hpt domain-containing protein [Terrabacter carboxydivorans]|uniref:HPt domain-containing protein n=1 Tax=Terrabacter carboxydivorans TaxID=619730 RepID=A0ABP5ZRI5_9MICO